jgi:hypothetical protein
MLGLSRDGLIPAETVPQKLLLVDIQSAEQIVSFCELPREFEKKAPIEQWDNIPAVSENYDQVGNVILERLNQFLERINR